MPFLVRVFYHSYRNRAKTTGKVVYGNHCWGGKYLKFPAICVLKTGGEIFEFNSYSGSWRVSIRDKVTLSHSEPGRGGNGWGALWGGAHSSGAHLPFRVSLLLYHEAPCRTSVWSQTGSPEDLRLYPARYSLPDSQFSLHCIWSQVHSSYSELWYAELSTLLYQIKNALWKDHTAQTAALCARMPLGVLVSHPCEQGQSQEIPVVTLTFLGCLSTNPEGRFRIYKRPEETSGTPTHWAP